MRMPSLPLYLLLLFFGLLPLRTDAMYTIGVNYGQLGDNLPTPQKAVELIKSMKIGKVKIYDANPAILKELANTDIKVCVMLPNEQIVAVANNMTLAEMFVRRNISVFYPSTKIRTLLVGNEILSASNQTWPYLVPAMINLHKALRKCRIRKIKVSTPLAMDMLQGPLFPPSNGSFRTDIGDSIMKPMLSFLHHTRAPLFVDVYPFFARENDATNISLEFALFAPDANVYKDSNGPEYGNLLDVQLDAVLAAMAKKGFPKVEITISETGWPTREDLDERGASVHNAALYNRRLVKRALAKLPLGTPRRPGRLIDTYIFALFNENLKGGPTTERNWGLLYPNGTRVYDIDLTGYLNETQYRLSPASPVEAPPGQLKIWCIANPHADATTLGRALSYACGQGSADCKAIQPGQRCFWPNSTVSHASYAFNNYYNQFHKTGATCIFGGVANLTTQDPSHGSCIFSPSYV
ncbi:hypothetical protein GOP47_0007523 [Adiantum capillus-veneris]|uniref:glucan endo-1,3-beta-D-glucosidase n=1 Tax=Adiantum capillus-veneris TaxID=13818 RepID=A0A9D4V109_ADICA|nr:hypothetical protein GOP47_0007523 [Adiantum capillus-veneris]